MRLSRNNFQLTRDIFYVQREETCKMNQSKVIIKGYAMNFFVFVIMTLLSTGSCTSFERMPPKEFPEFSALNVSAGETRNIYYHNATVAVVKFDSENQAIHCELFEA